MTISEDPTFLLQSRFLLSYNWQVINHFSWPGGLGKCFYNLKLVHSLVYFRSARLLKLNQHPFTWALLVGYRVQCSLWYLKVVRKNSEYIYVAGGSNYIYKHQRSYCSFKSGITESSWRWTYGCYIFNWMMPWTSYQWSCAVFCNGAF